jgi:hypothetical protein
MSPEQLGQFLDELGRRLGPAGTHVFEVMVRQVALNALVGMGFALFWFLLGMLCVFLGRQIFNYASREYRKEMALKNNTSYRLVVAEKNLAEWCLGAWSVAIVGFLAGTALAVGIVGTHLPNLLNPEYQAIMDILNRLPGSK